MDWANIWQWINTNNGAVSALATVVAATIAALALASAARDSSLRTRPMLTAELQPAPNNDHAAMLAIRNDGPTPAKSVRVEFTPKLVLYPDSAPLMDRMASTIAYRYNDRTIAVLNPGQELKNIWYRGPGENELPLPEDFTVTLSYRQRVMRRYVHVDIQSDVALYENDSVSSTSQLGAIRKISKDLESIKRLASAADEIVYLLEKSGTQDDHDTPTPLSSES